MHRDRPASGWRATALAVALLAITFDFLQPLAHAALMRDGGLPAWAAMCRSDAATDGGRDSSPPAATLHECCLGLAHATQASAPPSALGVVDLPSMSAGPPFPAVDATTAVGSRDGPGQPRAPPVPV